MTVAATQDFGALLGNSGFDLGAFGAAMSGGAQPTPANYVEKAPEQDIGVGQMKAEAPQAPETEKAVGQNAGMASIIENLSAKAAEHAEQSALTASAPVKEDRSFEQYDKGGKFDVPLLNMLQDAVLGDKKEAQGMDCSLDDVACQNVGAQQRSAGVAQGR